MNEITIKFPILRNMGIIPYQQAFQAMKAFTDARNADTIDEFWLLQHQPVYTQGLAGKPDHILSPTPEDIPIIQTDRGGQVTYHGPGQLILYPLINLNRLKLTVKRLVCLLEQSVIDLLQDYDVIGQRKENAPGIYVDGSKICSLGLKIRRGCSYHGLALNVDMDLSPFLRINPCGYSGLKMTQLKECIPLTLNLECLATKWANHLIKLLEYPK